MQLAQRFANPLIPLLPCHEPLYGWLGSSSENDSQLSASQSTSGVGAVEASVGVMSDLGGSWKPIIQRFCNQLTFL